MIEHASRFYGDETTTGRWSPAFRYLGRATIAARADDPDGFEWLLALRRNFAPDTPELKADHVLELIEHNANARSGVFGAIGSATILIIDFADHYRQMFAEMALALGLPAPDTPEAIDFLLRGEHRDLAGRLLSMARQSAIYTSAVPTVEALFRDALTACHVPSGPAGELVDRKVLAEMGAQEFRELLGRFAMKFGDALDPEKQAIAFLEAAEERFIPPGYFSLLVLGDAAETDLTLDVGSIRVYEQLRNANDLVVGRLASARLARLGRQATQGGLRQEDSRLVLGVQAADVAAGIAAREYERYASDRRQGAVALKRIFERVFFNDEWI